MWQSIDPLQRKLYQDKAAKAKKENEDSKTRRSARLRKQPSVSPNAEKSRKVEKVEKDESKTTIVKEIEKIEDPNQNDELKIPTPKKPLSRQCCRPGCENSVLTNDTYCSERCNVDFVKAFFAAQFVKV